MNTASIFAALPGSWDMVRTIPGRGHIIGTITFTAHDKPHQLYCAEQGLLYLDQVTDTFEATRSYLYELRGEQLFIFYNDGHRQGEVLHELHFNTSGIAQHCHVCAADTYDLTMKLVSADHIEMDYTVKGSQKDYTMLTVLTRRVSSPS